MKGPQTRCRRCGTCCTSGGPALHTADRKLIDDGTLLRSQLITIRKGELVHHPVSGRVLSVARELLKISGIGREWQCFFFDPNGRGCTIYEARPETCRALECWNTGAVERLIEKDLLGRADLIPASDPLYRLMLEHEAAFPCPDLARLRREGGAGRQGELEEAANREAAFRAAVVARHELSLGEELFYFGRPLFHLLLSVGARIEERDGRLIIGWK